MCPAGAHAGNTGMMHIWPQVPETSSGGGPRTGTRCGSVSMEGWQAEGVWAGGHVAWSTKGFTKDRAKNAGPNMDKGGSRERGQPGEWPGESQGPHIALCVCVFILIG